MCIVAQYTYVYMYNVYTSMLCMFSTVCVLPHCTHDFPLHIDLCVHGHGLCMGTHLYMYICTCTYSVSQKSPPLNYSPSPSICPLHSMVESPHLQSPILPPHPLCFQYQCLYECVIHHLQVFIPCIWSAGTPRTGPQAGTAFQPQLPFHTILYFVVTREYRH